MNTSNILTRTMNCAFFESDDSIKINSDYHGVYFDTPRLYFSGVSFFNHIRYTVFGDPQNKVESIAKTTRRFAEHACIPFEVSFRFVSVQQMTRLRKQTALQAQCPTPSNTVLFLAERQDRLRCHLGYFLRCALRCFHL